MNNKSLNRPDLSPLPSEPIARAPAQTGQRLSLQQALALATQHQEAGRLRQSEMVLKQILQTTPKCAPALHLLGVIAHRVGKTEQAVQLIDQAIKISPNQPLFHANRGEMCRLLGRLEEAIQHGKRAVELDSRLPPAHSNLGIAYYDLKEYERAEACQERALDIDPAFVPALNNLGSIHRQRKHKKTAIEFYQKVLSINPEHIESLSNLGAVLTEEDRHDEAIKVLIRAIKLKPNYAEAHCNIANAFLGLEQFDKAKAGFHKALEINPQYLEAHMGAARVYQENHDLPKAEQAASHALAIDPEKAEVHSLLGGIYTEAGSPERAQTAYEKALQLDSELISAHLGQGTLLMERGEMEAAEASFQQALILDPDNLAARVSMAQVKKMQPGDENITALEAEIDRLPTMPPKKATSLHFGLGKCYDDSGDYDKAFQHFLEGGRLKRSTIAYDPDENDKVIQNIKQTFDRTAIEQLRGAGDPSVQPIFVLGMPRSGTTLTEQIIASHSQVFGAGELPDLLDLANNPSAGKSDRGFPLNMQGVKQSDMTALGEKYVTGLQKHSADALRITDKMPANFLCVGLIHLMLPNAKIIHVKRSPVDTCLSGFSKLFNKGQAQSYDLTELGRYYRNYAELMAHWRAVLPENAFIEVQYEDLVADQEGQARRLLDYCDLEWDENCLEFHKTKRSIRTASVAQVRQPIYTSSVERWRRYEQHLGPLFDALRDLAPPQTPASHG